MSTSMLGNEVKLKDKERAEIDALVKKFLKSKNKITVCPPLPEPSLPEPSKALIKPRASKKVEKVDRRKRTKVQGIPYDDKNVALIEGYRFGKLMPMFRHEKRANDKQYIWACLCDCGQMIDVRTSLLTRGIATSCIDCKTESRKGQGG